jgi:hypothetical protein
MECGSLGFWIRTTVRLRFLLRWGVVEALDTEEVSGVDGRGMSDEIDFNRERLKYKNA